MERLKRRTDFRAAAQSALKGMRAPAKAFVLQARSRGDQGAIRVGFTVSRQVGNAVERNRVRRRLREIIRLGGNAKLRAGHDYVLIGRRAALQLPFADMMRDLDAALRRVHATIRAAERGGTGVVNEGSLHKAGSGAKNGAKNGAKSSANNSAHSRITDPVMSSRKSTEQGPE